MKESANKDHHDVVLVTDKVLAATLIALSHEVHNVFEYNGTHHFYALFKITKRLRQDLRQYDGHGLVVNTKLVGEQLEEMEIVLADYVSEIEYEYRKRHTEAFS